MSDIGIYILMFHLVDCKAKFNIFIFCKALQYDLRLIKAVLHVYSNIGCFNFSGIKSTSIKYVVNNREKCVT